MKKFSFLEKETAYAAALSDTQIYLPKNLKQLWLSFQGDMTAGAAVAEVTLLAGINPFELKVNAIPRIRLTGNELRAFNELFLDHHPVTQKAGATTDDKTRVLGLKIPMGYPSPGPVLHYNSTYSAVSGVDTMLFSLTAEYQDAALAEGPLHIIKSSYTAAASGSLMKAFEQKLIGDLLGVLFWVTTAPQDDADTCTIAELELSVGGESQVRALWWDLYRQQRFVNDVDGTATVELFDNYGLLDLRDDPVPAGSDVRIDVLQDTAAACSIIPIQRVAP